MTKLDKKKFRKRKSVVEKTADKLVDQHIKNEQLRKKEIDPKVFKLFK